MAWTSEDWFNLACELIPGGVNSPVRAYRSVGGMPFFVEQAAGSRIRDVEGKEYVDYVGSWGPMILGHAHPAVVTAIAEAAARGTSYGAPTPGEVEMAMLLVETFPSIEKVRLVSSGTEAVMSAIRLARGFTGREKILKFEGCYHGHADSLLVKAGSGVATFGIPGSPGVPKELAALTITVPFNNQVALEAALAAHGDELACVIVEPVPGNMGVVLPKPGFLETLREATRERAILLIFDEVISGFRVAWGGWQTVTDIAPDLTCLGKIIGGGLPVGAFGGRADIMDHLAPAGPVYQAGTLSGNPLAMAAGLATLRILQENAEHYESLDRKTFSLCFDLKTLFDEKGIPVTINRSGSLFTVFFTANPVTDFAMAAKSDTEAYARWFRGMLERGISLPPSQFEACFVSFAHTDEDFERTLTACRETLAAW
ncbi:MAG: glutamate-1-semialdehyde-2,1-aminomutase [Deltaproteobacteria bacterium HGW-Deltaproteobacteria-19]|jgi:glutamate-1-semialdehyde 2,1-aminomutase|nr:MAG: glutamate-1-semialdehyde-2,1-aminomutase [Deltaproteobacteria bacterium HGW-Deltaproteobacteria-19]